MWRKNTFALLVGMQTGAATVESSMEFPQKIKNGTSLWLSNSTSGNLFEVTWNSNLKEYNHPYVHCSIIYNIQDLEAPQVSLVDEWIKQPWYIYTIEYYSPIKKKKILPFVTAWVDLENIMLNEICESEKDKQHIISLICGI